MTRCFRARALNVMTALVVALCVATPSYAQSMDREMSTFIFATERLFADPDRDLQLDAYERTEEENIFVPDLPLVQYAGVQDTVLMKFIRAPLGPNDRLVMTLNPAGSPVLAVQMQQIRSVVHDHLAERFRYDPKQSKLASSVMPTRIYEGCIANRPVLASLQETTLDDVTVFWGVEIATILSSASNECGQSGA